MIGDLAVVMTSIPEREAAREETLCQLFAAAGIDTVSVSVQPGEERGGKALRENQRRALRAGISQGAGPILYLEDDITISRRFPEAIEEAVMSPFDVVTFYATNKSFYTAPIRRAILSDEPYDHGVYRLINQRSWFGTQAVWMNSDFAERVLQEWDSDQYLDDFLAQNAPEMGVYCPNPVQHSGADLGSTWSPHGRPHKSISYQP